jgi:hypothetical protein
MSRELRAIVVNASVQELRFWSLATGPQYSDATDEDGRTPNKASARKPNAILPIPDVMLKRAEYRAPWDGDNPTD